MFQRRWAGDDQGSVQREGEGAEQRRAEGGAALEAAGAVPGGEDAERAESGARGIRRAGAGEA